MATRLPWLKFFPRDWMADDRLRLVSVAARGLWMDVLCLMHQSPERGYLLSAAGDALDPAKLARVVGETATTVTALVAELETAGVFSRDDRGVMVCRRMVRDEAFRERQSRVGRMGGNPDFRTEANPGKRQRKPGKTRMESPTTTGGTTDPTTAGTTGSTTEALPHQSSEVQRTEDRREEKTEESSEPKPASEPNAATIPTAALAVPKPEPIPDPVLTHFPASGPNAGKGWPLRQSKLAEWEASYPGLDCRAELRKAKQWLLDNPGRRKTLAGMPRFLGAWLARAQDQPRPKVGPAPFDRGAAADARITGQILEALPELFQ